MKLWRSLKVSNDLYPEVNSSNKTIHVNETLCYVIKMNNVVEQITVSYYWSVRTSLAWLYSGSTLAILRNLAAIKHVVSP